MPTAIVVFKISKALNVPDLPNPPAQAAARINGDMEEEINELFAGKEERRYTEGNQNSGGFLNRKMKDSLSP